MACCPTCGQNIPELQLFIDVKAGRVTRFGWEATLTRQQMLVLLCLFRASPNVVGYDQIIQAIYGDEDEPDWADATIKLHVHRLKKKLKGMGLEIRNRRGEGYSLHSDAETLRAAKRIASRRGAA